MFSFKDHIYVVPLRTLLLEILSSTVRPSYENIAYLARLLNFQKLPHFDQLLRLNDSQENLPEIEISVPVNNFGLSREPAVWLFLRGSGPLRIVNLRGVFFRDP